MESTKPIVYLTELHRFGYLLTLNAFVSRVLYVDEFGNEVDTYVENDEFEVWEEPFTYEQERYDLHGMPEAEERTDAQQFQADCGT